MPHVIVKLYAGRTAKDKQRLADAMTRAIETTLGDGPASVSVAVEDVPPRDWLEQVYRPDIAA